MAWFELHQTLSRHQKTLRLATLLRIERREAVGLLVDLWSWALDNAHRDGTLNVYESEIAVALDWPVRRANVLVNALVESGYLDEKDGKYCIHEWGEYTGRLQDKRAEDARRQRESRARRQQREGVTSAETAANRHAIEGDIAPDCAGDNCQNVTPEKCDGHSDIRVTSDRNRTLTVPNLRTEEDDEETRARVRENPAAEGDAGRGEEPPPMLCDPDMARVVQHYEREMGRMLTPAQLESISARLTDTPADLICEAVNEAVRHDARSMAYVDTVLANWAADGVADIQTLALRREEIAKRKKGGARSGADRPGPDTGGSQLYGEYY